MIDYCPMCGADDSYLNHYMNGETECVHCGHIHSEEEDEE